MQTTKLALVERPTGILRAAKVGPGIISVGGIVRDCADCADLAA